MAMGQVLIRQIELFGKLEITLRSFAFSIYVETELRVDY